jgi:hypothetical protein
MFELKFDTGNAAFTDECSHEYDDYYKRTEICRILDSIKYAVEQGYNEKSIIDSYGNKVGKWVLK